MSKFNADLARLKAAYEVANDNEIKTYTVYNTMNSKTKKLVYEFARNAHYIADIALDDARAEYANALNETKTCYETYL